MMHSPLNVKVHITSLPPKFLVYVRTVIMTWEMKVAVWAALIHQNTINKT